MYLQGYGFAEVSMQRGVNGFLMKSIFLPLKPGLLLQNNNTVTNLKPCYTHQQNITIIIFLQARSTNHKIMKFAYIPSKLCFLHASNDQPLLL